MLSEELFVKIDGYMYYWENVFCIYINLQNSTADIFQLHWVLSFARQKGCLLGSGCFT